jgi:MFS transporter, PHS family, inorganic phosphate transporter
MKANWYRQGLGNFTAALIAFISIVGFKNSLAPANSSAQCGYDCMAATDKIWRIIVGFGTVPAVIALYFRLTIPETPRYTIDIGRDIEGAIADSGAYLSDKRAGQVDEMRRLSQLKLTSETLLVPKASWKDFWGHFLQWRYGKILLGTAGSWFFVDIAFYGLGLNNSIILGAIGYASSPNVYDNLYNVAVGNLVLAAAGNVPGYWVSVATIDTIGRKPIQLGSFIILTVLFCIIGFGFHKLSPNALFALYVLCQFFFNFGANSTTFVGNNPPSSSFFVSFPLLSPLKSTID